MMPYVATWMDLQMIREVKSDDRERQISYDTANMQTLKSDTYEVIHKIETDTQSLNQTYDYQMGQVKGRIIQEVEINTETLLYVK